MPHSEKIEFQGSQGHMLAARLEMPDGPPRAYALFAHCFTCSKDIFAAARIANGLAELDIAVLRFDFTGLGASDGDFANTNFSSNINDLLLAADHLRNQGNAPTILIGHSLGGIAATAAACELDEIQAVATIASPSRPAHVLDHFEQHIPKILKHGFADVDIFDQSFKLTKEYIQDLKSYDEKHFI